MDLSESENEQDNESGDYQDRTNISGSASANESECDENRNDNEEVIVAKKIKLESNIKFENGDNPTTSTGKTKNKKTIKWQFLEHKGPIFPPDYQPLPANVKFIYDKKEIKLSPAAEEVAGFYAQMLDHKLTKQQMFNNNFFTDWCTVMTDEEKALIKDFTKCDFTQMNAYFKDLIERKKKLTKADKKLLKSKQDKIQNEYGYCIMDGRKEKICNYKIEAPGLFIPQGKDPKMGKLKTRVRPEDMTINCSQDSVVPKPPEGCKWGKVVNDNTVSWLASWVGKVSVKLKYVELDCSSQIKRDSDKQKYETARKLDKYIDEIRNNYTEDSKTSKSIAVLQRAVALYFIDKLALRAGNEKDEDQADTVGCCSLRVEHVELHEKKGHQENVVELNFLGKDSIQYYNEVSVDAHIFNNLKLFKEGKKDSDDLFDKLDTKSLNDYLKDLMPELTAKVFRTYNASKTLQTKLDAFNKPNATLEEKIQYYRNANFEVAILCNHQRTARTDNSTKLITLKTKIRQKRIEVANAKTAAKRDRAKKELAKLETRLEESENKKVAPSTSREHYMDPRITVAWCLKHNVPIHKVYSKGLQNKFLWAIKLADKNYVFG